jgi:hypothetical protein
LLRTVSQFGELRFELAGILGAALLVGGVVDTQERFGVILISVGTGVIASTVVAAIALEREDFAQSVLGLGIQQVFHDRAREFDNAFWQSLIDTAKHRFAVLGVANHGYLRTDEIREQTEEAMLDAVERNVEVQILWLDPRSPLAAFREESEGERGTRADTVASMEFFWALRERAHPDKRENMLLAVHEAMPTCGITWSDDLIIVSHYLAKELNLESPGLVLGPSMSLTDRLVQRIRRSAPEHPPITATYVANYREIADSAVPLSAELVAELRSMVGTLGPESAARKSEAELRKERGIDDAPEGSDHD